MRSSITLPLSNAVEVPAVLVADYADVTVPCGFGGGASAGKAVDAEVHQRLAALASDAMQSSAWNTHEVPWSNGELLVVGADVELPGPANHVEYLLGVVVLM